MNALLQTAVLIAALGQPEGTIAVQGGDLALVTFSLPPNAQYQLDYPFGQAYAWFDSARANLAYPFGTTYTARSKGDLDGDGVLDGRDVQSFVTHLISGPYDARADFNDDGVLDSSDAPGMIEALTDQHPANGVVLHVEAVSPSSALGDAPINLLTFVNGNWVVTQTRPMTLVQFQTPSYGGIGTPAEFYMTPAIAPLAFASGATATWSGIVLVSSGTPPSIGATFAANQVHIRSAGNSAVITGDGMLSAHWSDQDVLNSFTVIRGRMTFNLNGISIRTPEFDFYHAPPQFQFVGLEFDPHDPGGYPPTYGSPFNGVPTLSVYDPSDPQLDTFWYYQVALQVGVEENADTVVAPPSILTVDLIAYDASGNRVDSVNNITLSRIDNDGDPYVISLRSDLVRPFIMVDAAVNKAPFPDLRILRVSADGYVVVRSH